jgi:hypothetical protein
LVAALLPRGHQTFPGHARIEGADFQHAFGIDIDTGDRLGKVDVGAATTLIASAAASTATVSRLGEGNGPGQKQRRGSNSNKQRTEKTSHRLTNFEMQPRELWRKRDKSLWVTVITDRPMGKKLAGWDVN